MINKMNDLEFQVYLNVGFEYLFESLIIIRYVCSYVGPLHF